MDERNQAMVQEVVNVPLGVEVLHGALNIAERFDSARGWVKEHLSTKNLAIGVAAGALALSGCGGGSEADQMVNTANVSPVTQPDAVTGTSLALDGTVTDGSDATVRMEDDANLYDCGGVKGETWKNEDGSAKEFTPDHLISHMNANPELAKSDQDFWVQQFGGEGFTYLTSHAIVNKNHEANANVVVDGVSDEYNTFLSTQIAAEINHDQVAVNHSCTNDKVEVYNLKSLKAGEATLTGTFMLQSDFAGLVDAMGKNGKSMDKIIHQSMKVDIDGDGEADTDVEFIAAKHEMCGNNELVSDVPLPPETPPEGGPSTTTTTHGPNDKDPTLDYNVQHPNGPNNGPGSGGDPGVEGTTSTTAAPKPNPSAPTTTTTQAGNGTTTSTAAGPWVE